MDENKKHRINRALFLVNGLLFSLGVLSLFEEGKTIFTILLVIAVLVNLIAFIRFEKDSKGRFVEITFLLNIIVAAYTAYDYVQAGKTYIQYAWMLAALITLIGFIIHLKRKGKGNSA